MKNNIDSFLNFHEFGEYELINDNDTTSLYKSSKNSSPSQEYFFRIFKFKCSSPKDQKIILDTFYQIRRKKCQYLLSYSRISFTFKEDLTPAFSMKNIASHTLKQILSTDMFTKWNIDDVLKCLFAVAEAMAYLHSHLICHGNLCPSNVVTDMVGQFYLIDFGLYPIKKLYYGEKDMCNDLYKDPYIESNEPTFKNDVYSFGVLMSDIILLYLQLNNDRKQESLESFLKNTNRNKFDSFPKIFAELIPACLNSFSCERPSFKRIVEFFQTTEYEIFGVNVQSLFNEFNQSNYLINLASNGDHFASNKVGEMYETGKGFKKDLKKAAEYYKLSADLNNSEAQNHYGVLLQEEADDNIEDLVNGAHYLQLSAEQGNIHGMANYGVALLEGKGVEKNIRKAEEYLKKSADLGYSFAQGHYGWVLLNTNPTLAGINDGLSYIKKAMSQRNIESFYQYGLILLDGKFVEKNENLAIEYFKVAADMGSIDAMIMYADCNMNGIGIPKDEDTGLKYYQLAAYNGSEKAKEMIFSFVENNINISKQPEQDKANKQINNAIKPDSNTIDPTETKPEKPKPQIKQLQQQQPSSTEDSPNSSQELPTTKQSANSHTVKSKNISTSAKASPNNSQELPKHFSQSSSNSQEIPKDKSSDQTEISIILRIQPTFKDGNIVLPYQISNKLRLISLGHVIYDKPKYHNEKYIFPVGYQIEKEYFSIEDPNKQTIYRESVLEGIDSPIFRVECLDGTKMVFEGTTPSKPWNEIKSKIEESRKKHGIQIKEVKILGATFFGFSNSYVTSLIDKLPNADRCTNHVFKKYVIHVKADESEGGGGDDDDENEAKEKTPTRSRKPRKQQKTLLLNNEQQNPQQTTIDQKQQQKSPPSTIQIYQININNPPNPVQNEQLLQTQTNNNQFNQVQQQIQQIPAQINSQQQIQQNQFKAGQQQTPTRVTNKFNAGQQQTPQNQFQFKKGQQQTLTQMANNKFNTGQINNQQQQNTTKFNNQQQQQTLTQMANNKFNTGQINNQQQQNTTKFNNQQQNQFQFNNQQQQNVTNSFKREQTPPPISQVKKEKSFDNLNEQAQYYISINNINGAIKCYEEAARNGDTTAYIRLAKMSSNFEDKLKYSELAIKNQAPGCFINLRALFTDRYHKTKDFETFEKIARLFEKYDDFSDAAFVYKQANDLINFKILYEKAKKKIDDITDGEQMFLFSELLKSEKDYDLFTIALNKSKELNYAYVEQHLEELARIPQQKSVTPPPQEITAEIETNISQGMSLFDTNRNQAFLIFSYINEHNWPKASFIIANFLKSKKENAQVYLEYYKTAADQGIAEAQFEYGKEKYENGKGIEKEEGISYLKKSAEQLYPDGLYLYSTIIKDTNPDDANKFYKYSIEHGSKLALKEYEVSDEEIENDINNITTNIEPTTEINKSNSSDTWFKKERDSLKNFLLYFGWNHWEDSRDLSGIKRSIQEIKLASRAFLRSLLLNIEGTDQYPTATFLLESSMSPDFNPNFTSRDIEDDLDTDFMKQKNMADPEFVKLIQNNASVWLKRIELLYYITLAVDKANKQIDKIIVPKCNGTPPTASWTQKDDQNLIYGIWKHGVSRYDQLNMDPELSFTCKGDNFPSSSVLKARVKKLSNGIRKMNNGTEFEKEADDDEIQSTPPTTKTKSKRWTKKDRSIIFQKMLRSGVHINPDGEFNWSRFRDECGFTDRTDEQISKYIDELMSSNKGNDNKGQLSDDEKSEAENDNNNDNDNNENEQGKTTLADRAKIRFQILTRLRRCFVKYTGDEIIEYISKFSRWPKIPKAWTPNMELFFYNEIANRGWGVCSDILTNPTFEGAFEHGSPPNFLTNDMKVIKRLDTFLNFVEKNTLEEIRQMKAKSLSMKIAEAKAEPVPDILYNKDGTPTLPIQLTPTSFILSLGRIVTDRPLFHNENYIYPAGFKSTHFYTSCTDPSKRSQYICEIVDKGEDKPYFVVSLADDPTKRFEGTTPSEPWNKIVLQVRFRNGNNASSVSVSGPEYFGLTRPQTKYLIQQMDGAKDCSNYIFKQYEQSSSSNKSLTKSLSSSNIQANLKNDSSSIHVVLNQPNQQTNIQIQNKVKKTSSTPSIQPLNQQEKNEKQVNYAIPGPSVLINMNYQFLLDQLQNKQTSGFNNGQKTNQSTQNNNEGNSGFHWKV